MINGKECEITFKESYSESNVIEEIERYEKLMLIMK